MNSCVLIPAYKPDGRLVELLVRLAAEPWKRIILVNDGSGEEYEGIFTEARNIGNVVVLEHAVNLGKGRALKTGLNHYFLHFRHALGIVTADADGQHTSEDIVKAASALEASPDRLILGARTFSGKIPFRSWIGNLVTRYAFWILVGVKLTDTQSGLRCIPGGLVPDLLKLPGERFDFELNMLIEAKKRQITIQEIPIETVYWSNNESSHFNPLRDSMAISFLLLRFGFSSLLACAIDLIVFAIAYSGSANVFHSIVLSRAVSSTFNFLVNKSMVFNSQGSFLASAVKYWMAVLVFGFIAYLSINSLVVYLNFHAMLAKMLVETLLFLASFSLQRDFIFVGEKASRPTATMLEIDRPEESGHP